MPMRFLPDWAIYLIVIAAIVFALFSFDEKADAPPAAPEAAGLGAFLPPPSDYDPQVLVDVGPVSSGLGTAFAISRDGWWLTARHVVDACDQVGVIVTRGAAARAREVRVARFADLALVKTDTAPVALALDLVERELQVGEKAYHVGYPQGRPGEAYSQLIGRETLIARGRYDTEEPVLAWAEIGRTGKMSGSLAGISGGPAIAANGEVIGVTIAESARRGRLYTAAPSSIARLLRVEQVAARGEPGPRLEPDNYGEQADRLRRTLAVAQIVCVGPEDAGPPAKAP
jgi:serine protease Do